jgi:hypothetical protein
VQWGRQDRSEASRANDGADNIHHAVLASVDTLIGCENNDDQGYADCHDQVARG